MKPLILLIIFLSVLMVVTQLFQNDLVFYRDLIGTGQWWRIMTGNFVHSNITHLAMNLAGLWILGFLFIETLSARKLLVSILLLSFAVGLGLYFFDLNLQRYYGFSGILYGLFLVGAASAIYHKDLFTGLSVGVLIIAKIAWDLFHGGNNASAELIGMPVAVHAHLYGALAAITLSIAHHMYGCITNKVVSVKK